MDSSWLLVGLVYAALIVIVIVISKLIGGRSTKLPPGPKAWPIIGNLNLIGPLPHRSLHRLSQKHGDIMLLKFGKFPVVIASSPTMAEQFLKSHDAVFASRPLLAAGRHISFGYSDVSFAPYGPYWRQARKLYMTQALSAASLHSWARIRAQEQRALLSRLQARAGDPVALRHELLRCSVATIRRFVFSDDGGFGEDDEVVEMVKEWLLLSGAFNLGDWIPWLSRFDLQGYVKRMKGLREKMDRFYDFVIDHRLAKRGGGGVMNRDFLQVLVEMGEDPNAQVELNRDCVKALIMNLLVGGTDTAASTVEWAIHEILKQPRIIEKAKAELNRVIGRNKWIEEKDVTQLPYIDAIIIETFRLRPIATLLAPRYAMQDCTVAGYDIEKGTTVIVNPWSIQRDPKLWDAPQEFIPERFIGKTIDLSGTNFSLLPFGSGRRRCAGYNLGLQMVRTTLANLLHGFELKLEEGIRSQDISMEEEYGLATHPKHPLSIIFTPTLPHHLY